MVTDDNLRFGVRALQAGLIDTAQFAAACEAWAEQSHVPLADLLQKRGWITAADRARLERPGSNPGQEVQVGPATGTDPQWQPLGLACDESDTPIPLGDLALDGEAEPLPALPHVALRRQRYTLTRVHGTGGIGRVWSARDDHLGRDVALKELRPDKAADRIHQAWFLREARLTGQLEHPGIVPVYELSRHPGSGQPFYTMRFVKGRTLSEAAAAYHRQRAAGRAEPLALPELLHAFLTVCQVVAYAHARGVIHRDLKGENVVLGDFGEVLVLDWGLAKVLRAADGDGDAPPVLPDPDAERPPTVQGQVLGTPAYMAPEQAAGQLEQIGPATDGYGLGAVLYEILTGRPPFVGADPEAVLEQVRVAEPARPRQVWAGVPPALEAVCLRALTKEPAARYASARELAHEVQCWLADEPVRAYPESWARRVGRWGRRHKPLLAAGAALLGAAVVSLAVLVGLSERARARLAVEQAQTEEAREEAVTNYHTAQRQRQRAREAVDRMLTRISEDREWLREEPRLEGLRRKLLEEALGFYRSFLEEDSRDPVTRRETAQAYVRLADLHARLGHHPEAQTAYEAALALQQELVDEFPGDPVHRSRLALSHLNLSLRLVWSGRVEEAETAARRSLEMFQQLAQEFPAVPDYMRNLILSHLRLTHVLRNTGRHPEALAVYRQVLNLGQQLGEKVRRHPDVRFFLACSQEGLASTLMIARRRAEAEDPFRQAVASLQQLTNDFPKVTDYRENLASAHHNLAVLLRETGRMRDAEQVLRQALALKQKLADDFPQIPAYGEKLANAYHLLGMVQVALGRRDEAEQAYRRGLEIIRGLADESRDLPACQNVMGRLLNGLAILRCEQGEPGEARHLAEQAIRHQQAALKRSPRNPFYQECLYRDHLALGEILARLGEHGELAKVAAELPRLLPQQGQGFYEAGKGLACCAALAQKDARLPEDERQALRQAYARQALEWLRQAFTQGFTPDLEKLNQEPAFAALRGDEAFQELVRGWEAQAEAAPAAEPSKGP